MKHPSYFLDQKKLAERARNDGYSPFVYGVPSDSMVPNRDIAESERIYRFWRDRAGAKEALSLDAVNLYSSSSGAPARTRASSSLARLVRSPSSSSWKRKGCKHPLVAHIGKSISAGVRKLVDPT